MGYIVTMVRWLKGKIGENLMVIMGLAYMEVWVYVDAYVDVWIEMHNGAIEKNSTFVA